MNPEQPDRSDQWDAIVVGSGATGGWCCKHLTEAGLRVLLLEAGPEVPIAQDLKRLNDGMRGDVSLPTRVAGRAAQVGQRLLQRVVDDRHPIQRRCYRFHPVLRKYFVDDIEHPYSVDSGDDFNWIRSRSYGGRTVLWARITVRMSNQVFHAGSSDGHSVDWPIAYEDLVPYYDQVEKSWEVYGYQEGWEEVPDGSFIAPPEYTPGELDFKERIERHFPGRYVSMIRKTPWYEYGGQPEGETPVSTSAGSFLRDARRTGRLEIQHDSIVGSTVLDETGTRATGVEVVDRSSGERRVVRGKAVFLAASTLESTRILMNHSSPRWPNGLGNDGGVLGHYLADHLTGPGLLGVMDGPPAPRERGLVELYTPNWLPYDNSRRFPRGYQVQTMLGVPGPQDGQSGWSMNIFGEVLPKAENRVELDHNHTDAFGLPTLRVHFERDPNDEHMAQHALASMIEMAECAGLEVRRVIDEVAAPGTSVHEVGTARMGNDPGSSVVNRDNRVHGCDNVLVVDGASWPTTGYQNPTLTMVAVAARACDRYVASLQQPG